MVRNAKFLGSGVRFDTPLDYYELRKRSRSERTDSEDSPVYRIRQINLWNSKSVHRSLMRRKQDFVESLRIVERCFSREDMNYDTYILELVSKITTELHIVSIFRKKKTYEYYKEMMKLLGRNS